MSDLEQALSEAQRAREEAEAAAQRAADLEAQADAARERAQQQEAERRRTWAQTIVNTYETEISNADAAIQQALEHFNRVAAENLPGAVEAYTAWGEASMRHYALQLRVSAAAEILDLGASPPEFVTPPLFSEALDAALVEALRERTRTVDQEFEAKLAALGTGPGVRAPSSPSPA